MSTRLLQARDYSVELGGKRILDGVSFTVADGEFLCVVGPNGAGKTTLLKCIARIVTGGHGDLILRERALATYAQRELARTIAYVPQGGGQRIPFTVREFVQMGRYPHLRPFSSPGRGDAQAVDEALAITGTEAFARRRLGTLSGGERQKVLIAAALAQQPQLLLLDEPTTYLDPRYQTEILTLLRQINRDGGVTVLAVTHDLNTAVLTSDRILALKDGAVVADGPPADVMNNESLVAIFGKPFLFVEHPQSGQRLIVPELPR